MDQNIGIMERKTMLEIVNQLLPSDSYIGMGILPFRNTATEKVIADMVLVNSSIANYRAPDGEAELKGKNMYRQMIMNVVDIAKKERFNTSDLRAAREAGQLPVYQDAPSLISQIGAEARQKFTQSLTDLRAEVDTRLEAQALQALQGSVSSTDKIKFSVDYGIPADQKDQTPTTDWDDEDATPSDDLIEWQEKINDRTGVLPNQCIMSRKSLLYCSKVKALRDVIAEVGNFLFSINQTKSMLQDHTGLNITVYDAQYHTLDEDGTTTSTRFLDANKIILYPGSVPNNKLGETLTCPHPHANFQPGFYTWDEMETDPYGYEVGVGITAFPIIYHPELLFNASVYGNES
jgi:hypothetical protein